MKREAFEAYLVDENGGRSRHVQDVVARAQRVNDAFGDLDEAYVSDELRGFSSRLGYSVEDAHNHVQPPRELVFHFRSRPGTDAWYTALRNSMASLRNALSLYADFCSAQH